MITKRIRRRTRKHKIKCVTMPPQGGEEFNSKIRYVLTELSKYSNTNFSEELVLEVLRMAALLTTLQGCDSFGSMSSAIYLFISKYFNGSHVTAVAQYLEELFVTPQDGEEEPVDTAKSFEWLELIRNVKDNWSLVKGNKLFSHFSKLLGLIVTMGLCEASSLTFSIKEYKVWEPDLKHMHGTAMDVVDAALTTVIFFVETLSLCYQEQSLKPLLVNDKAAAELDEEYANIVSWFDLVKNGNLEIVTKISEAEFDRRLEALCTKLRNLMATRTSFEKKLIQDKFMKLLRIKNDYITMKISSGVRKAPFCVELFGESSQGKTTIGEQLIEAMLTSAGLPTGKEYQASYNASDKFMSNWTSDKLVLLVDDMANDKSNFVERPPTRIIIDVCNNTPFYANMADVDSKGKVFVEPSLLFVTTNVQDLDARVYSNCPYSVQRRMHAVITVEAKKEFQYVVDGVAQGIDPGKVQEYYATLDREPTFDDIWNLTVSKAKKPEKLSDAAPYIPITWRGKIMKDVSFRFVLQYLIESYQNHIAAQEGILRRMRNRQTNIKLCGCEVLNSKGEKTTCKQIQGYCDIHENKTLLEKVKDYCMPVSVPKVVEVESDSESDSDSCETSDPDPTIITDSPIIVCSNCRKVKCVCTEYDVKCNLIKYPRDWQCSNRSCRLTHKTYNDAILCPNRLTFKCNKEICYRIHYSGTCASNCDKYNDEPYMVCSVCREFNCECDEYDEDFEGPQPARIWQCIHPNCEIHHKTRDKALACSKRKPQEKIEPHYGEEILESLTKSTEIVSNRIKTDISSTGKLVEGATTICLMSGARMFAKHFDWISMVPSHWLQSKTLCNMFMACDYKRLRKNYMVYSALLWSTLAGSMYLCNKHTHYNRFSILSSASTFTVVLGIGCQRNMANVVSRQYRRELVDRNTIAPMLKELRDKHVSGFCAAAAIVGGLYTIAKVYRLWRSMGMQGSLEPLTQEEVDKRDKETNVWTSVSARPLPIEPAAANTTSEQLVGLVKKNLVYGTVVTKDKKLRCNGLYLSSNVVLVPNHYFTQDVLDVTFRKKNPEDSGGKFAVRLSKQQSWLIPGSDLRYCYSSSGGSFKDISKYLTDGDIGKHDFHMLWRDIEGKVIEAEGLAEPKEKVSNGVAEFEGFMYTSLTMNTFKGLCGAVCITKKKALISSIHLGGYENKPIGCSGRLFKKHYTEALEHLRSLEGVIISGSAEQFEAQVLGVNIIKPDAPLHPKSPLNYMPKDSQVEYYGSCPGMTTFKSDVKPTLISEHVTDVTGEPNIYGPPVQHPQYFGWQNALSNFAVPALPFMPDVLEIAIKDYKSDLIPIFQSNLWKTSRPLTDHENLCGIPGKKFMDSIKLSTSIGFPLSGPKRNFVTQLEPTEDKPNNLILDDVIMEEINRCLECYKRGERAYPVAKACKKDEILSKPKCRIFYGNSISLTYLVRKYFLPILRVLQMNPIKAECAVGINSHGPEWDQLHKHIYKFGADRLMGGDYGKYDQKLPSQVIFAALRILIDFARECEYSEEDIRVMEAMTGDIVYAVIAFNGDLIGLTEGTHISGNSLTVIINGICGSLNLRCYFYTENRPEIFEDRIPFREVVALVTYGDDNIGSVSDKCNNFTIKGASEFLGKHGQVYTMPDKESELTDFLPSEDFEFLKRKSVYHKDLGLHLGALIDKSCFKMLHCYLRSRNSPLTEELACAQNIDTALREWFNHGPELYEQRRIQMVEIAQRASITHLCTELEHTYADKVAMWREKYTES